MSRGWSSTLHFLTMGGWFSEHSGVARCDVMSCCCRWFSLFSFSLVLFSARRLLWFSSLRSLLVLGAVGFLFLPMISAFFLWFLKERKGGNGRRKCCAACYVYHTCRKDGGRDGRHTCDLKNIIDETVVWDGSRLDLKPARRVARKILLKINRSLPGHAVFAGMLRKGRSIISDHKKWPSIT